VKPVYRRFVLLVLFFFYGTEVNSSTETYSIPRKYPVDTGLHTH
jgi:hypothetical protein